MTSEGQNKPEKAKKFNNSPSPEQINFFFQRVKHYQDVLNLRDWRIEASGRPAAKGAMADVGVSLEDRLASVSLGKDWGGMQINDATLSETALHEVLHVFTSPYRAACESRDSALADSIEHSLIVVLEKLIK